jgi:hypothetical protein
VNAVLKLSRDDSTAAARSETRSPGPVRASTLISADIRPESRRLRRTPTAPTGEEPSGAKTASSGVMRPVAPNSAFALFNSEAPSPKNHDGIWWLGNVGLDVTRGGPGAGSVREPVLAVRAAMIPPYASISQRGSSPWAAPGAAQTPRISTSAPLLANTREFYANLQPSIFSRH